MFIITVRNKNSDRSECKKQSGNLLETVKLKELLYSPRGFQEMEAPRFQDSRHMNVVRLSALRTARLYTLTHPRKYSWYSFLSEAESTPGSTLRPEGLSTKNSNGTIGNRTRDLPACSAVPQPTRVSPLLETAKHNIRHTSQFSYFSKHSIRHMMFFNYSYKVMQFYTQSYCTQMK